MSPVGTRSTLAAAKGLGTSSSSSSSFRLQQQQGRPSILLFGDSITEYGFGSYCTADASADVIGWASLLSAAYTRRCDVLNRGFSGYNTRHALEVLPRVVGDNHHFQHRGGGGNDAAAASSSSNQNHTKNELLFCTVFFGANDAVAPGEPQHVPVEEYATNLDMMVREIRKRCCGCSFSNDHDGDDTVSTVFQAGQPLPLLPIILLTPPPVDEAAWAAWRQIETSDRSNDVARKYGSKVKEVAAAHQHCSVVDTWELLMQGQHGDEDDSSSRDESSRSQYLSDGLHLNQAGNRMVYRGLMDVLQRDYPHLVPVSDEDGEGRYGTIGIPKQEKLWKELC